MDERNTLIHRIHALDFAILELGMFLDIHPCNETALCKRREYLAERAQLIETYEAKFGPYVINSNRAIGDRWSWIMGPWPWEYGKEC